MQLCDYYSRVMHYSRVALFNGDALFEVLRAIFKVDVLIEGNIVFDEMHSNNSYCHLSSSDVSLHASLHTHTHTH